MSTVIAQAFQQQAAMTPRRILGAVEEPTGAITPHATVELRTSGNNRTPLATRSN